MTAGMLVGSAHLGDGQPDIRNEHIRIITETAGATPLAGVLAGKTAAPSQDRFTRTGEGDDAAVTHEFIGFIGQFRDQFLIVGFIIARLAGIARTVDAGPPAEHAGLNARIVGNGPQAGRGQPGDRLLDRVGFKRVTVLDHLRIVTDVGRSQDGELKRLEDLAEFLQLLVVARGQQQPIGALHDRLTSSWERPATCRP